MFAIIYLLREHQTLIITSPYFYETDSAEALMVSTTNMHSVSKIFAFVLILLMMAGSMVLGRI